MAKILVLDDNPVLLSVARASLESVGHEVVTAESPIGFSTLLLDHRPDLALVDVLMPALAGPRLIELVRAPGSGRRGQARLVLYSGIRESELVRLVAECGADGYILKSRQPTDLPKQVARFLPPTPGASRPWGNR